MTSIPLHVLEYGCHAGRKAPQNGEIRYHRYISHQFTLIYHDFAA